MVFFKMAELTNPNFVFSNFFKMAALPWFSFFIESYMFTRYILLKLWILINTKKRTFL